jgi:hypothetical protein
MAEDGEQSAKLVMPDGTEVRSGTARCHGVSLSRKLCFVGQDLAYA